MKKPRLFPFAPAAMAGAVFAVAGAVAPCRADADLPFKKADAVPFAIPSPIHAATEAEDMALVRQRLRDSLLAGLDAKATTEAAQKWLALLRPDGSFPDQDYADTDRENWKAEKHLPRLVTIAQAVYLPGAPLASQAAAKEKLVAGLVYWLKADPQNTNWWQNEIGVPKQIGALLILMGSDAPQALQDQGIALMKRSNTAKMTGQNLVWTAQITIMRGCLSSDAALVGAMYDRMWQEVRYAGPNEEGIQRDASFHQHGALLYSGGYGAGFTSDVARFQDYARGTRWALPPEKENILEAYVLDGQQWMVRGTQWDWGVTGRELIRAGKSAGGLLQPVEILAKTIGPRQKELAQFAARLKNPKDAPPLVGNRHYYQSDYMAHSRAGYLASTRMYSTRIINTDGYTNGENKTSHHLADGATFLAHTGQEFVGIYPVWDWHRIPGTTIEQNTPLEPKRVNHRGTTRFVGGVSDGMYGATAMDLASGDLTAKKAWFYFDDEIVCLGAGITCPTANPVYTSLNQTLLSGPVKTSQGGTAAELPTGDRDITNAAWIWHDGMGYVFAQPTTAHVKNEVQTGSLSLLGPWSSDPISKPVFSVWINHGPQAQKAAYAYTVLPNNKDVAQTAAYAKAPTVQITSNTPEKQAVWHSGLGVLMAAFRTSGGQASGGPLTVGADAPCLLMVRKTGQTLRLAVSNPMNEPLTVHVSVNLPLRGDGAQPASGKKSSVLTVVLPGGLDAGKSVVREFALGK